MITGEEYKDEQDVLSENADSCLNETDERRIVMTCQDIVHCTSHARVKLPKHISLAIAVRHLKGSKQLITLLNRMGHCSSYEEVEMVDTSLATEILAKADQTGVTIPSNILPGGFIQMAADNNDINEETIDGKNTTHATTIVVYQRKLFGPMPLPQVHAVHTRKRRSLDSCRRALSIEEVSLCGRRPPVTNFLTQIKMEWFEFDGELLSACNEDLAWMLLRLCPSTLFLSNNRPALDKSVPGWGGFHSLNFPKVPVSTRIGYCPMLNESANEFSTIYTVMKMAHEMARCLQENDSVITFDLAIYMKAKQLQFKFADEFKNTVVRMGGFHIALNFLSLLGKRFANSDFKKICLLNQACTQLVPLLP